MSRFYASIQGNRGEATRGGTKDSGIYGHIRGWHVGARVDVDAIEDALDEVIVQITGGSAGFRSYPLARIKETSDGTQEVTVFTPNGEITWNV